MDHADPFVDFAPAKKVLFIAEEHDTLYDLWKEGQLNNLAVCHVDFHCDMRGLLIDRKKQRARFVWQNDPYMNRVDSGSFLAHAVMNGVVSSLRWVHDEFGGREYDDLYCVKYETDFSALPFRFTKKAKWVPLKFTEQTFADWNGPQPGEYLSLDWDALAFVSYDEQRINRLIVEVLDREFSPEGIFVAHSVDYCHPKKELFDDFINRLEAKFQTQAVRVPDRLMPPLSPGFPWQVYHQLEHFVLRKMRRKGIY